jgi:hypothetical protein
MQGISRVIMSPTELKCNPQYISEKKLTTEIKISGFFENVLWVAFLIPSGSLSLVKYPVFICLKKQSAFLST